MDHSDKIFQARLDKMAGKTRDKPVRPVPLPQPGWGQLWRDFKGTVADISRDARASWVQKLERTLEKDEARLAQLQEQQAAAREILELTLDGLEKNERKKTAMRKADQSPDP